MRIGVDVDGVQRDFTRAFMNVIRREYPKSIKSEIITGWDFDNVDLPLKLKMSLWEKKFSKEILYDAEPIQFALEDMKILKNWCKANNSQLICATYQSPQVMYLTTLWLKKYNLEFDEIHITENKQLLYLDYLIDDAPKMFTTWIKCGNSSEHFLLMDTSYNQMIKSPNRIYRIKDAIKIFEICK